MSRQEELDALKCHRKEKEKIRTESYRKTSGAKSLLGECGKPRPLRCLVKPFMAEVGGDAVLDELAQH